MPGPKVSKNKSATEAAPAPLASETISKAQAVRNALADGLESPGEIVEYLKAKHGLEVTNQQASLYKSQAKKKATVGGTRPKAPVHSKPAPKITPTGEGDLIDALKAMKPLIAQYGSKKVKEMVDLLG